jgi:hypothetical protein
MSENDPRDMIGYGRTPLDADWPGGARSGPAARVQFRRARSSPA